MKSRLESISKNIDLQTRQVDYKFLYIDSFEVDEQLFCLITNLILTIRISQN